MAYEYSTIEKQIEISDLRTKKKINITLKSIGFGTMAKIVDLQNTLIESQKNNDHSEGLKNTFDLCDLIFTPDWKDKLEAFPLEEIQAFITEAVTIGVTPAKLPAKKKTASKSQKK